jgi:hypothetical protein
LEAVGDDILAVLVRTATADQLRADPAGGLARDTDRDVDPVGELHHHLDAAARALQALEGQRRAA